MSETQSTLETFVRPAVKKFPPHSTPAVQLTDAIADFIARDIRPVSVVDGDRFLQVMQLAEPRFVVPCRKTMMSVIDRKYTVLKRTVHEAMIGQHKVTLTTDMWTSQSEQGYFLLTTHYVYLRI